MHTKTSPSFILQSPGERFDAVIFVAMKSSKEVNLFLYEFHLKHDTKTIVENEFDIENSIGLIFHVDW